MFEGWSELCPYVGLVVRVVSFSCIFNHSLLLSCNCVESIVFSVESCNKIRYLSNHAISHRL